MPALAAGGSVTSGGYVVRYSAINSTQIPASVAADNGIERDRERAVVMVTLQRPTRDAPLRAAPAQVSGSARTLMGERQRLRFRRIEGAGSVYSLAPVTIGNEQTLTFDLEVSALDGGAVIPVTFNQTFYTD